MIIRCAFFRGHIKSGREAAFALLLKERLIPLCRQFPGAEEVRVLHHARTAETGGKSRGKARRWPPD